VEGRADHGPTTAGHALHDLLDRLRLSGNRTVHGGWSTVLDAEAGSVEWARRHAEVVGLYQALLEQVMSLPEGDRTRSRALQYAPAWYSAVVWQSHWKNPGEPPSQVLDDATLDHLGSIADILAYRLPGAASRPSDEAIGSLRQELEQWLDLLNETDSVPPTTREEIVGQIRHVLWLLENVETFGAAPAVRQARLLVGRVTETMATQGLAKKWATRVGALVLALGLLTQGLEATTQALEAARDTVVVVSEIVRDASGSPEGDSQPALTSGSDDASEGEVVEPDDQG
jgi:hypothetical protein